MQAHKIWQLSCTCCYIICCRGQYQVSVLISTWTPILNCDVKSEHCEVIKCNIGSQQVESNISRGFFMLFHYEADTRCCV